MELTDLTKEQRQELNPELIEMLRTAHSDQEVYDFILAKHPKLVSLNMQKYLTILNFVYQKVTKNWLIGHSI